MVLNGSGNASQYSSLITLSQQIELTPILMEKLLGEKQQICIHLKLLKVPENFY